MDYKEFIDMDLAKTLDNVFTKMGNLNIINEKELKANIEILGKLRKEIIKEEKKKNKK